MQSPVHICPWFQHFFLLWFHQILESCLELFSCKFAGVTLRKIVVVVMSIIGITVAPKSEKKFTAFFFFIHVHLFELFSKLTHNFGGINVAGNGTIFLLFEILKMRITHWVDSSLPFPEDMWIYVSQIFNLNRSLWVKGNILLGPSVFLHMFKMILLLVSYHYSSLLLFNRFFLVVLKRNKMSERSKMQPWTVKESMLFVFAELAQSKSKLIQLVVASIQNLPVNFEILMTTSQHFFKSLLIHVINDRIRKRFDVVVQRFIGQYVNTDKFGLFLDITWNMLKNNSI